MPKVKFSSKNSSFSSKNANIELKYLFSSKNTNFGLKIFQFSPIKSSTFELKTYFKLKYVIFSSKNPPFSVQNANFGPKSIISAPKILVEMQILG